jgi:predicted metal-dependent phosphoesterase TrpH
MAKADLHVHSRYSEPFLPYGSFRESARVNTTRSDTIYFMAKAVVWKL